MSQPAAQTIKRRTKAGGVDFEFLRARGIEYLQALSGHRWTDYNLHDPGVTILEQLCYALTELIYRGETDMADLLTAASGEIDFERLSLHAPQVMLPCRPSTATDYRCLLLDAVSGVDEVRVQSRRPRASRRSRRADPVGLHHLVLRPMPEHRATRRSSVARARAVYLAHRNLCEDLHPRVTLVRDVPCELHADIEIAARRDPVDLLAEVYLRCETFITARCETRALEELLAQQRSLDEIFDGPLLERGFFDPAQFTIADAPTLFIGDLAEALRGIAGVQRLNRVALQCGEDMPSSGAIRWRGPDWALRLRVPQESLAALRVHRQERELLISAAEVYARYQDLRAARRMRHVPPAQWLRALELPRGSYQPPQRYFSIQNQFPANYGIGAHGTPGSASRREKAQSLQLQGYLLLFEQVLAHGTEQLQHLQELFSAHAATPRSHWWQMLDGDAVREVDELYLEPLERIQSEAFEPFDNALERKHRVLDYLLALHGDSLPQRSLRQFFSYLEGDDLERRLLENKAAYLRDIVRLTRDRASGFDYSRVSWDDPDNCSGLQRRVSLLLGFTRPFSHSLTAALRNQELSIVPRAAGSQASQSGRWMAQPGQVLLPVPPGAGAAASFESAARPALRAAVGVFAGWSINEELFRLGVHRQRYRLALAPGGTYYHLLLGPDARSGWWHLGDYVSQAAAAQAADALRAALLQLNHDSEGLHLVEHLLLRPVGACREHAGAGPDFYSMRLTVVFPAWSARCHQREFRSLAEQTVQLQCPAHIQVDCRWLDFEQMLAFESRYVHWLQAKLIHAQAPERDSAHQLNRAAAALIDSLQAFAVTGAPHA
jgi:hypothetical protein